jgi:tryptophan-rich sensory protein
MPRGLLVMYQRPVWKFAGYGFVCCGALLCTNDHWDFYSSEKRPNAERPYKAFGYPVLPIIYILMGTTFCLLLIKFKPDYTWPGLIITLIGIPIYYIAMASKKSSSESGPQG